MHRSSPLLLASLAAGLLGCDERGPQHKQVTITASRTIESPTKRVDPRLKDGQRFGARPMGQPRSQQPELPPPSRLDLSWSAPSSWQDRGPSSMRRVTFQVAPGTECYLVTLPGQAGGVSANVNRWRKQMGLGPLSPGEIAQLPKQQALGVTGVLIEAEGTFTGMGGEAQQGQGLMGLILSYRNQTVFVKMTGPLAEVQAAKPGFLTFCRSLRDGSQGETPQRGPAPERPPAQRPAPPRQSPHSAGPSGPQAGGGLKWSAPEGWSPAPSPSSMRVVTFSIGVPGECYVTALRGAAGGETANLQRWRKQLGLEPLDAAGLEALPKVEVLGQSVRLLEGIGAYAGMGGGGAKEGTYLIGCAVPAAGQTYFVKLIAPGAGEPVQREAFLAFVKSLKIEQ